MKRLLILLPSAIALAFIPLKHTGASSPFLAKNNADAGIPVASSVLAVSGTVSGLGVAGSYVFSRRQR